MRQFLEEYNVAFVIAAIGCLTIVMKSIAAIIYHSLTREAGQMGSTKNKKMKSFITKFEAAYKLKMEVHNVGCRVEGFLYNLRVLGISLEGWKNIGIYGSFVITLVFGAGMVGGLNYSMTGRWFVINSLIYGAAILLILASELVLQNHRRHRLLYVQMLDYAENTLKSHMEKEYLKDEEMKAYQMEYFNSEEDEDKEEEEDNKHKEAASTLENIKLLEELIEQL